MILHHGPHAVSFSITLKKLYRAVETAAMEPVEVCLSDRSHNKLMMALVEHHSSIPDQDLAVSWFSTSEDLNFGTVRATPYPSVADRNQWSYNEEPAAFSRDAKDILVDTQIPDINHSFPTFDAYATPETENPMACPTDGNTQAPNGQGFVPEICLIPDSRSGVSTPEPLLTLNMSTPSDIDSFLSDSNLLTFDDAASLFSDSQFHFHGPATPVSLTSSYHRQDELTTMIQERPVIEYDTSSDFLRDFDDAFAETETCQPLRITMHGLVEVSQAPSEVAMGPAPSAASGPITKNWELPKVFLPGPQIQSPRSPKYPTAHSTKKEDQASKQQWRLKAQTRAKLRKQSSCQNQTTRSVYRREYETKHRSHSRAQVVHQV